MPLEIGTNQLVAAIRDQAGNTDYTTNSVFMSAASTNMQYEYNAAGCMTDLNGVSLEWDERYRLKNVDGASCSVEYEYDVLNRRISRAEGGTTNYFVYNGQQVVADLDGSGNLLRSYVWGTGIDNLLSFTDHTTSNTYYAIKDHQNSVIALVDENGTVVESYEYDTYGNTTIYDSIQQPISSSAVGNRYLFQGREYDSTTGLYYFRARWYDPNTGRWLSKDPAGIRGGLNQYVAFGNNPIIFVDPSGLAILTIYADNRTSGSSGHGWISVTYDNGSSASAGNYPGGWRDDSGRATSFTASTTFDVTDEQASTAYSSATQPGYNFFCDNCVDRVEAALDAAGIQHPSFNTAGVSDPRKLYDWIKSINHPCGGEG